MIGVLAFFGTLIAIGTVADVILNILKLDIIPEKFLQVTNSFLYPIPFLYFNFGRFSKLSQFMATH